GHHADRPVLEVPVRRVQAAPVRPPDPPLRKVRSRLVSHVRTHTRRTKHGTVKVRQHSRKGRLQPKRAWANAKRAYRAARRKHRGKAATFRCAAVLRIGTWTFLKGVPAVLGG